MKRKDAMRESVEAQTLLYAVQRAMFCQSCDAVLDVRRAVLAHAPSSQAEIVCSVCWDARTADGAGPDRDREVIDGRVVGPWNS